MPCATWVRCTINQGRLHEALVRERREPCGIARAIGHVRLECIVHCNLGLVQFGAAGLAAGRRITTPTRCRWRANSGRSPQRGTVPRLSGPVARRAAALRRGARALAEGELILQQVADRFSLGLLQCHRAELEHLAGDDAAAHAAWLAACGIEAEVKAVPSRNSALRRSAWPRRCLTSGPETASRHLVRIHGSRKHSREPLPLVTLTMYAIHLACHCSGCASGRPCLSSAQPPAVGEAAWTEVVDEDDAVVLGEHVVRSRCDEAPVDVGAAHAPPHSESGRRRH